jgi:hypothetical protein
MQEKVQLLTKINREYPFFCNTIVTFVENLTVSIIICYTNFRTIKFLPFYCVPLQSYKLLKDMLSFTVDTQK